jgi:CDP-glucose 4,6-dehydratase
MEGLGVNPSFWVNKRVFITGHTGFKGGWLSLWLLQLGAKVTGYALAPTTVRNIFELANVATGMRDVRGDIRNFDALFGAIKTHKPEIIFHLAAQPIVKRSYQDPIETYSTNVMGTVNLLESVRKAEGIRAIVNITTDKCYENKEWVWGYRENEPMGGYDPYSNSKGCSELVTSSFRSSFFNASNYANHGVAIASARAGNVIGGGDWASNRLIPDIIKAYQSNAVAQIRNPNAIRPWQHVLEPLRGYLMLAERLYEKGPEFAEAWNFGPTDQDVMPVNWIAERLRSLWGSDAKWEVDTEKHPHEATLLKLDISKAKEKLDWKPKISIDKSLDLIVDWHRAESKNENMREKTLAQITNYQKSL